MDEEIGELMDEWMDGWMRMLVEWMDGMNGMGWDE